MDDDEATTRGTNAGRGGALAAGSVKDSPDVEGRLDRETPPGSSSADAANAVVFSPDNDGLRLVDGVLALVFVPVPVETAGSLYSRAAFSLR